MGFESERGDVNPTGFESEQVAVIDHYARHGDQYERRTAAYPGRFAGLFNRNRGDGFRGGGIPTVRVHRTNRAAFRLCQVETRYNGLAGVR